MFNSSYSTARRFCLVLLLFAATALSVPSAQPAATFSYPASASSNPGTGQSTPVH